LTCWRGLSPDRHGQPIVAIQIFERAVEFILRRSAVSFFAFPDRSEKLQGGASEKHLLWHNLNAMYGCCMNNERLDKCKIDTGRDLPGALFGVIASEADQSLTIRIA
jgi:hypothetical protein